VRSGVQLGPLGTAAIVPAPGDYDNGEIGGMIGRGNWSTQRKPAPVLLSPPQIPHTAQTQTRPAAVGNQWLRPWPHEQHLLLEIHDKWSSRNTHHGVKWEGPHGAINNAGFLVEGAISRSCRGRMGLGPFSSCFCHKLPGPFVTCFIWYLSPYGHLVATTDAPKSSNYGWCVATSFATVAAASFVADFEQ
jgi:hypothetical protein